MLRALHRSEQVGLRTGSDLATHTRGRQCSRKDSRLLERLTGVALQLHMGRSLGCLISGGEASRGVPEEDTMHESAGRAEKRRSDNEKRRP